MVVTLAAKQEKSIAELWIKLLQSRDRTTLQTEEGETKNYSMNWYETDDTL